MGRYRVEVADDDALVSGEACDEEADVGVGAVAVAQCEVVGGREDVNAVGEVLVPLPAHVLLEGRRRCDRWAESGQCKGSRREEKRE